MFGHYHNNYIIYYVKHLFKTVCLSHYLALLRTFREYIMSPVSWFTEIWHTKLLGSWIILKVYFWVTIHNFKKHTSIQRQFKTVAPQGGVYSPTLFHVHIDLSPPRAPVLVMAYADDITIKFTSTSTSAANKCMQPYLHTVFSLAKQNILTLNPDKTTCTLFTPDHADYTSNLDLKIHKTALHMATKVSGYYLRHNTHTQHTPSHHFSTRTQASRNNISNRRHDGVNRRRHSCLHTRQ